MKACLLTRMALEGKTRQASTSADATAKRHGKTKLFSEMTEMHRKAERKGDEATWAGTGRGLNVTEVTEGLTIVELNDQIFASVRRVSYGKQTTTTGQGTASGKW